MIVNIIILYVDDLQHKTFIPSSFVTFQRLSLSNYKMATPNKRDGPARGTPKRDAKKTSFYLGAGTVGFGQSSAPVQEKYIEESGREDGGSIILNFEDLSASVESLASGMCGNRQLVTTKKTIRLAT
jgi:hypothetical protein